MTSCCYAEDYGKVFGERAAWRAARRFRRHGLRPLEAEMVDSLLSLGIEGATVLEVGGGLGAIQLRLLQSGAARSVNVELSPEWERPAAELLAEQGLTGRVERRVGDFVSEASSLPDADVVILHRVICCYPDWEAMISAALGRTRHVLAFTVPTGWWGNRLVVRAENSLIRLTGSSFRAFVHPPDQVIGSVLSDGLRVVRDRSSPLWRLVVAARPQVGAAPRPAVLTAAGESP